MKLQIKVKKGAPQKMPTDQNPTFEEWMGRVDSLLSRAVGLSSADLADQKWREWYDARLLPIRAANRALRAETE